MKIESLNKKIGDINTFLEKADASFTRLDGRIKDLDKNAGDYSKKIRELKDDSQDTKKFLDTPLPADLQRLLSNSTKTPGN